MLDPQFPPVLPVLVIDPVPFVMGVCMPRRLASGEEVVNAPFFCRVHGSKFGLTKHRSEQAGHVV